MKTFEPAHPDDFLIVYHREQARAHPQFKPEQVLSYLNPQFRGRTPRRIFRTGLGQSRQAYETLGLLEQYAYTHGTEIYRIEQYGKVQARDEFEVMPAPVAYGFDGALLVEVSAAAKQEAEETLQRLGSFLGQGV